MSRLVLLLTQTSRCGGDRCGFHRAGAAYLLRRAARARAGKQEARGSASTSGDAARGRATRSAPKRTIGPGPGLGHDGRWHGLLRQLEGPRSQRTARAGARPRQANVWLKPFKPTTPTTTADPSWSGSKSN